MVSKGRLAALAVVVVLVATGCWHDVGSLGGVAGAGVALGINDRGEVVGFSRTPSGADHAFIRNIRGGDMVDITPQLRPDQASVARAVNEVGMVAGTLFGDEGRSSVPFFWWPYSGLDVLPLAAGVDLSEAMDINRQGQVLVIGRIAATGKNASFIWDPGSRSYTPLPPAVPGGHVIGYRFDDHGGVVGRTEALSDDGSGPPSATVWDPVTLNVHVLPQTELGAWANGRNASGLIVGGQVSADGTFTAVYWTSLTTDPVELLGAEALAVNNAGQIVGARGINLAEGKFAAVMWEPNRPRTTDLGDKPGGSLVADVNNAGESAGWSVTEQGENTPVWWDPPAADAPNSPVSPMTASAALGRGPAVGNGQRAAATAAPSTNPFFALSPRSAGLFASSVERR